MKNHLTIAWLSCVLWSLWGVSCGKDQSRDDAQGNGGEGGDVSTSSTDGPGAGGAGGASNCDHADRSSCRAQPGCAWVRLGPTLLIEQENNWCRALDTMLSYCTDRDDSCDTAHSCYEDGDQATFWAPQSCDVPGLTPAPCPQDTHWGDDDIPPVCPADVGNVGGQGGDANNANNGGGAP